MRVKSIIVCLFMISGLLACSKDKSVEFSPSSVEFENNGGTCVLSMAGVAASSTDLSGFYGIEENGVFHYVTSGEADYHNADDGSLLSVSYEGLSVTISNESNMPKKYILEASPNNTGAPRYYSLEFSHGNEMIIYKVSQK